MAEVRLKAEKRDQTGKGGARKTRASGLVPGVVYGRDMEAVPIAVERRALFTALQTDAGFNVLLDLDIDGTNTLAITRELQRDPVKGTVLHADFVKVDRKKAIEVDVPLQLVGESVGVKEGGVLEHPLFQLHIRCLPTEVPEHLDADITSLNIGDVLRVSELTVPTGIEVLNDPDTIVASVAAPISEEQLEAMEAEAGIEAEAPEEVIETETAEAEAPEGEEQAREEGAEKAQE